MYHIMYIERTRKILDAGLQPIDSAPQDGTRILVLTSDMQITIAFWDRYCWRLNVCGTSANDGDVEPIAWKAVPAELLALNK